MYPLDRVLRLNVRPLSHMRSHIRHPTVDHSRRPRADASWFHQCTYIISVYFCAVVLDIHVFYLPYLYVVSQFKRLYRDPSSDRVRSPIAPLARGSGAIPSFGMPHRRQSTCAIPRSTIAQSDFVYVLTTACMRQNNGRVRLPVCAVTTCVLFDRAPVESSTPNKSICDISMYAPPNTSNILL